MHHIFKLLSNWSRTLNAMRQDNKRLSTFRDLIVTFESQALIPFYFYNSFSFLLTLTLTQMTSHESSEGGNTHSHTNGLA
jgi:hypothetical protein